VIDDARIDFWAEEVRKMPLRGEITISDKNDYLHIRKVNPERD
jgi:hypothetical protein